MKILFFITSSMEKPSPSWHLMKALLEDTLKAGISVHAIQRHYKEPVYDTPFPREILEHPNFTYSQIDSDEVDRKAFVKRYLGGIGYARRAKREIKKHNDFDMVFVQSAPTSLFYLNAVRSCAKARPVLYNSQDMFPGSAISSGVMKKKWMQNIFFFLQKFAYKKANVITAISEDMKKKLMEQGVSEDKIRVIVNWYDDAAVREIPWVENRFASKYELSQDKFYVQYAGTMGNVFNHKIILDVAERLKEYSDIEFQMIGNGVNREPFEKSAEERGLSNIVFYPLQPQDTVADVYSACSVCLIPLKQGVIGNSVPSKAGLLMACGRVIVNSVDKDSDYYAIFEREDIGRSAGCDEPDLLAEHILYYYKNPDIRRESGERAKEYGGKYYSRTYNTEKYTSLFKEMVEK